MKHFPEVVKRLGQKHHKIISNQNNRVVSEWNRENTNSRKIRKSRRNPRKSENFENLIRFEPFYRLEVR